MVLADHVLEALSTLGFPEYIEDVKAVYREYREQASVRMCRHLLAQHDQ